MKAYEDMIRHTASPQAPWYVIPADNKWFTRVAVAAAIVDTLEDLKLAYPEVDPKAQGTGRQAARRKEEGEGASQTWPRQPILCHSEKRNDSISIVFCPAKNPDPLRSE